MFLGNVPQATPGVMENMGVSLGLVGCIQSLKINSKEYDLVYPGSLDIEDGAEIGECGNNPCASLPCQNGGTCVKLEDEKFKCMCQQSHTGETCEEDVDPCSSSPCYMGATCNSMDEGSFSCKCPQGRTGEFCEDLIPEKHQTSIPEFNGRAYIEQPKLEVTSDTSLTVEIWFMAYSPNGMLLYNGQLPMGKGDFISINLVEGYVNYRYNLGSGTANITSRSPLTLNQWHQVVVTRYNRLGTLRVNDEELVDGESDPPSNELNLNQPLYIGGFSDRSQLSYMSGVVTGLKGAIQRVTVNGIIMGDLLESATNHYAVTRYFGPPCGGADENPCRNGGTCIPNLNDFMCKCSPDYMGKTCDKTAANGEMDKPVMFDGNLFLYYPNLVTRDVKGQIQNDYKLKLRTTADSGLILWQNMGNTVRGDYFAILLVDGYLQLNYNLGKQNPADLFIIRSTVRINDGEWHMIRVARNKRYGALTVDSHEAVTATSPTGATQLDTNGILWIGGAPNIPTELPEPYKQGFTGCIEEVFVGEQQLHLVHDGQNDVQTFCQDER
ncbi:PREDICTED: agrin-like [Priapulus caudatus]|uniref:Agrin-like n=1 Tax=Priapulus caudatus TaxID=37621 RepID=A0ABM1ESA4_PRICU|nr:PREDICTED: agrin-like [Priapulus caudatus]